jgi:hypothetical protein
MFKMAIASFALIGIVLLKTGFSEPGKPTPVPAPAPSVVAATEVSVTEKTVVYIKSGSRYHVKGCQYLKNKGSASTIGAAMRQGLAPCNVCHAPKIKAPPRE